LSSGGTVYGNIPKSLQVKENAELNPICAHGLMKICCEKYIKYFANKFKFKYLILRLANPYGRIYNKKRPQGIIDHVLFSAINNRPIKIWGSLDKTRDFIYIDDLCELLLLAVKKQVKSSCFNVGSGSSKSLRSIIKLIQITCRRKIKLKVLKERSIDVKYNQLNISKTKKYFNWTPLININRGIKNLYNQYSENINNYNKI
jgi:UDP-glucose 4-epimerase